MAEILLPNENKKSWLWYVDPFLVVINMLHSLEQTHPCPVRLAFIGTHVAFLPWSVDLFLATV